MFKVLGMTNQSIVAHDGKGIIYVPAIIYKKLFKQKGKREFIYEELENEIVIRISKRPEMQTIKSNNYIDEDGKFIKREV